MIEEVELFPDLAAAQEPAAAQPTNAFNHTTACIQFCQRAYHEALAEVEEQDAASGHKMQEHHKAFCAEMAWRCTLPQLDTLSNIQAFIGCVADGQTRRWISGNDSKALLYTAQLALAALKERK